MPRRWRARAPASAGPLWITAAAQTAGRGRRGRAWVSPPGNLYATLLLTRAVRRRPRAATCLRCGAGGARRDRGDCAPRSRRARAEMAERSPARRRQVAGILIEGEKPTAASPWSSASASIARTIRRTRTYPATDPARRRRRRSRRTRLFAALVGRDGAAACAMGRGRGLCRASAPTGSRAPRGIGEPIRVRLPRARIRRAVSRARRGRPPDAARPDGNAAAIAAGEVFPLRSVR